MKDADVHLVKSFLPHFKDGFREFVQAAIDDEIHGDFLDAESFMSACVEEWENMSACVEDWENMWKMKEEK